MNLFQCQSSAVDTSFFAVKGRALTAGWLTIEFLRQLGGTFMTAIQLIILKIRCQPQRVDTRISDFQTD